MLNEVKEEIKDVLQLYYEAHKEEFLSILAEIQCHTTFFRK